MRIAIVSAMAAWLFHVVGGTAQQPSPLFASDEPLHLVISAPINDLMRDRAIGAPVAGTLVDPAGQPFRSASPSAA